MILVSLDNTKIYSHVSGRKDVNDLLQIKVKM